MAELQQAAFLDLLPATPPAGFSRLYFGAEFCFWRMPDAGRIAAARAWAATAGWAFTLVTPVVGEDERRRLDALLGEILPGLEPGDEVVLSDWGALAPVRARRTDLVPVAGRTLSGQKRGPRIGGMELTPEQADYFRCGSWHNRAAVDFLHEQGIRRVEQDNLLQGLAPLPEPLVGSLHLPWSMVTSSRNCPFRPSVQAAPCPAPCGERFRLQAADTDVSLVQDGNTQFLFNDRLPADPRALRIDRLVRHPDALG